MKKILLILAIMATAMSANATGLMATNDRELLYTVQTQATKTAFGSTYYQYDYIVDSLNTMSEVTPTLEVYDDGTYILKAWCGYEGYDLEFTMNSGDSITVLNTNADKVITSKGTTYWRVPTGNATYDRACVYMSPSYSMIDIRRYYARIYFFSYIYPVGSNTGKKGYYAVKGFNPTWSVKANISQNVYSATEQAYVPANAITLADSVVNLMYFKESNIYVVEDFAGQNTTDIFIQNQGDTAFYVTNVNDAYSTSGYYYYSTTNDKDYIYFTDGTYNGAGEDDIDDTEGYMYLYFNAGSDQSTYYSLNIDWTRWHAGVCDTLAIQYQSEKYADQFTSLEQHGNDNLYRINNFMESGYPLTFSFSENTAIFDPTDNSKNRGDIVFHNIDVSGNLSYLLGITEEGDTIYLGGYSPTLKNGQEPTAADSIRYLSFHNAFTQSFDLTPEENDRIWTINGQQYKAINNADRSYLFGYFTNIEGTSNFEKISLFPLMAGSATRKGDVNSDEAINGADVVSVYNFIQAGEQSNISKSAADVNEDDAVNGADVVEIYNIIAGAK